MKLDLEVCHRIADLIRRFDRIRPQDGEDFIQDALVEMMERARRNGGGLSEAEMWRAARCVRSRYRRAYRRVRGILSLNRPIWGTETPIELGETLAATGTDLDAWLEAKLRLEKLPRGVLCIARKLEKGDPLTRDQQARLACLRQDGKESPQQAWALRRYQARRSRGLCVSCGQESDGFARCAQCRERFRELQTRHRRRKGKAWQRLLRRVWRRQGRCGRCGRKPETGRRTCSRCLAKNREYLQRHRARRADRICPARPPVELGRLITPR